jgi:hypothetical protein
LFLAVEKGMQDMSNSVTAPAVAKKRTAVLQGISGAQLIRIAGSSKLFLALLTFFLVNVTWVFFRSPDFATAWRLLTSMFTEVKGGAVLLTTLSIIKIVVIISLMLICHWKLRNTKLVAAASSLKWWMLGTIWAIMVILLILSQESTNSFIYFQF